jgi:hypothetical protein
MRPDTLTDVQFVWSQRLAQAHGHAWGVACEPPVPGPDATLEQGLAVGLLLASVTAKRVPMSVISRCTQAFEEGETCLGIVCPRLDADGFVVHRTTTRRLEWRVGPDGDVTLTVFRPHPERRAILRELACADEDDVLALQAKLDAAPEEVEVVRVRSDAIGVTDMAYTRDEIEARHVAALEPAFAALRWPLQLISLLYALTPDGTEFLEARVRYEDAAERGELD